MFWKKKERKTLSDQAIEAMQSLNQSMTQVSLALEDPRFHPQTNFVDGNKVVVNIPSSNYLEVAEGVQDRVLLHANHVLFEWEYPFKSVINKQDFDRFHVIFCVFSGKSLFTKHWHNQLELIVCLHGAYKSKVYTNKQFALNYITAGTTQVIPANKVHSFEGVEDGYALVLIEKSII